MSSSPSGLTQQVEEAAPIGNQKPEWLEPFLGKTFFNLCLAHPIRKNELNKYCINCNTKACQYCMASGAHRHHKILKIYRHVYRDVVSLSAMQKHIDCTQIQPYRCNKRLVISLSPLPHCGGLVSKSVASCETCHRRLTEPELNRFCCIACKVEAFSKKARDSVPPFLAVHNPDNERQKKVLTPEKRTRKRKGKPFRAPFF